MPYPSLCSDPEIKPSVGLERTQPYKGFLGFQGLYLSSLSLYSPVYSVPGEICIIIHPVLGFYINLSSDVYCIQKCFSLHPNLSNISVHKIKLNSWNKTLMVSYFVRISIYQFINYINFQNDNLKWKIDQYQNFENYLLIYPPGCAGGSQET